MQCNAMLLKTANGMLAKGRIGEMSIKSSIGCVPALCISPAMFAPCSCLVFVPRGEPAEILADHVTGCRHIDAYV